MTGPVDDEPRLVFDRLRISKAAWWQLHPKTRTVIRCSCLTKVIWSAPGARHSADRMRDEEGEDVRPYRCPFGHPTHWHVGHVIPMGAVEDLALAIRDLAGDLPTKKLPNLG